MMNTLMFRVPIHINFYRIIWIFVFFVLLVSYTRLQAAKRFSVGPTADWDYSTINDALAAQVPFTEDVILEVYMDPSGYNTKGIVEYSHLFGGYSLYITGVTDFPKAATYYVNHELEYEVPQSKIGVCRTTEYVKGADIVARRVTQGASTSGNQFYVKNNLGSTMFLTDAAATTNTAEADYFSYGKKINLTTTPDHVTQTFTGKEVDQYDVDMGEGEDGEGWYYFGKRYYDADIGRWTSTDPKLQFYNAYAYTSNGFNPIRGFDPDGNWFVVDDVFTGPVDEILVIGGLAVLSMMGVKSASDALTNISDLLRPQPPKPEPTVIYRMGSGTNTNLTPRPIKDVGGLSYQFTKPAGKFTMTTLEAINATGVLKAVPDGIDHISVSATLPNQQAEWINSRTNAETDPHPLTSTLKAISVKGGP
jgi:RHS repeat-associated protein